MRRTVDDFEIGELVRITTRWGSATWAGALAVVVGRDLTYVTVKRVADGKQGGWYPDQLFKPGDEEQDDAGG